MGELPAYVVHVGKRFIRLRVKREKYWLAARNLGAAYRWFPPAFGIRYEDELELPSVLAGLRDAGFAFLRTADWKCPAAIMEDLVGQAKVSPGFTSIEIIDREHWTTQKNEKRPATRPFFSKK